MAKRTEYEIALMVGGKVQASFGNSIKNAEQGIDSLNNMAHTAAAAITSAFAAVKVGQFVGNAVSTYSSFEQAMATTAATANASQAEYERLEQAALAMGKATTKTATEASEALGYMALAGWNVDQSISALEPVLRLSEATQMDLARCSDLTTDSMSALGLSVDELGEYLDICTAANNNANNSAGELMEAFIGCGGAARAIGADMLDTATALGILADNGKKGTQAGTALNAIMARIASNDTAITAMHDLGVSAFDTSGEFIGFHNVLVKISDALSGLSTEQQTAYQASIAGTEYYSQMGYLLSAVQKEANGTATAWDALSSSLENSDGALEKMAATVTDTLSTSFRILNSATEDAQIHLVDAFGDNLKDAVLNLAEFIPTVTDSFIKYADKSQLKVSKVFNTLQKDAAKAWEVMSGLGSGFIENFDTIETVVVGVGTAFVSYKVINLLIKGTSAVYGFGNAIKMMAVSNPVIFSITAAATAIAGITAAMKKAEEQAVQSNLEQHFGNIALSLEDVSQIADYIVMNDSLSKVQESLSAFSELDGIRESMEKSLKAINKSNWKVSIGMELTQSDKDAYLNDIQNYISEANEYLIQERYAANISFSGFLDGSAERQNIVSQMNSFYEDVYTELQGAGKRLGEAVTAGFEDSVLTPDEAKIIANEQEAMARIMNSLATSEFDAKLDIMGLQYSGKDWNSDSFQAFQQELEEQVEEAKKGFEEAWLHNLSTAKSALNYGSITQNEYDTMASELYKDYLDNVTAVEVKAHNFQLNTIADTYGDEIADYNSHMQAVLEKYQGENFEEAWESNPEHLMYSVMQDAWDNDIPKDTKQAMQSLLDTMQSSTDELETLKKQWEEAGMEAPAEVSDALARTNNYGAMTVYQRIGGQSGDKEALYSDILQQIVNNNEFADMEAAMREKGMALPDRIVESAEDSIPDAFEGLYAYSSDYLQNVFSKGIDVSADVNIDLQPVYTGLSRSMETDVYNSVLADRRHEVFTENPMNTKGITGFGAKVGLIGHADGGIFTQPHVAWFAEEGPEAAIPLDGSSNAIALWSKVGKLLGVLDGGMTRSRGEILAEGVASYETVNNSTDESTDSKQFVFAPKITIEGNASRENIDSALSLSMEQFRDIIEEYLAERSRVCFQ